MRTAAISPHPMMLAVTLLATACADPTLELDSTPQVLRAPIALGEGVLLVDRRSASATLVNASDPNAEVVRYSLPPSPILAAQRNGHPEHALVLSEGSLGSSEEREAPGGLSLLDLDGSALLFELGGSPFSYLVQQAAGRFAALQRGNSGNQVLRNVNEMAFVDLEAAPADAVRFYTLLEAPRAVFFSDEFEFDGEPLQLATVLTANTVAVFDLERPEAQPAIVRLSASGGEAVRPEQAYYDVANNRIYVRSTGTNDIFSLRLVPREPRPERVDFAISIDIIAAGRGPSDLQQFELDGVNYLLVVAPLSRNLVLVDVATSRTVSVRTPSPFTHAHIYYPESEGAREPWAMVWHESSGRLGRLKLTLSEVALDRSFEPLPNLPLSVSDQVTFEDGQVLFFGRGKGLGLANPELGTVTPYGSRYRLKDGLLDADRALFWVAPAGQKRIARLDLESGATLEVPLDHDLEHVVLIPEANKLAALHDNPLGHVTFVDLDDPSRNTSFGVRGFFADGLFE